MSLTSNFESRYSAFIVKNISNPQLSGATTKDAARIALAETDVKAIFEDTVGVAYDDDNVKHVAVAVKGMYLTLLSWTTQNDDSVKVEYDKWVETLDRLAKTIGGRKRLLPQTTSLTVRTSEKTGTTTPKPAFDSANFTDMRANAP